MQKTWPALLGVPLIIAGIWSTWRRPVALMLLGLSAIYIFGGVSGRYSYGRVVSYIVLLLHVILAGQLSALDVRLRATGWHRVLFPAGVTVVSVFLSLRPLTRTLEASLPGQAPTDPSYQFLARLTGQYDVVLSDLESSKIVPVFGGKVVAAGYSFAFVPDQEVRQSDVARFFDRDAGADERQQIVRRYHVDYLLLRKSRDIPWEGLQHVFAVQGRIDYDNDDFVLISLSRR